MKITKTIGVCIVFFAAFILVNCATLPEPSSENTSLLIGQVVQKGKGFGYYGNATVNGVHYSGIKITIQNLSSYKMYEIKSGSGGLFFLSNIPSGEYSLERMYLKVENGSAWADVGSSKFDGIIFTVLENKVNNIGLINWDGEIINGKGQHTVDITPNYEDVKDKFNEKYKKTKWNNKEWINIIIHSRA